MTFHFLIPVFPALPVVITVYAIIKNPCPLSCPGANHRQQLSGVSLLSLPKHAGQKVAESVDIDHRPSPKVESESCYLLWPVMK